MYRGTLSHLNLQVGFEIKQVNFTYFFNDNKANSVNTMTKVWPVLNRASVLSIYISFNHSLTIR